jgi:hypothetical protein
MSLRQKFKNIFQRNMIFLLLTVNVWKYSKMKKVHFDTEIFQNHPSLLFENQVDLKALTLLLLQNEEFSVFIIL